MANEALWRPLVLLAVPAIGIHKFRTANNSNECLHREVAGANGTRNR